MSCILIQHAYMKLKSFLKLLNRKINKYDRVISNPFGQFPVNITLVWVEEKPPVYNKSVFVHDKNKEWTDEY